MDKTYIIGIAQRITETECPSTSEYVHYSGHDLDIEDIKAVYEDDGAKWGPLVEHDISLVLSGYAPEYFLGWSDWEDIYRINHSILYRRPDPDLGDGFTRASDIIIKLNREDYAYHLRCVSGWACPVEQSYFYKSNEWNRLAKAERFIGGYRCNRCGTRKSVLHVHHESPIKSAYSPYFSDNFADWKLCLYCKDCHEWFHRRFSRQMTSNDFSMSSPQEMAKDRIFMREFWKRYHGEGKCKFCNNHVTN